MTRALLLGLAALGACGRLGITPVPRDADPESDTGRSLDAPASIDAPALPATLLCSAHVIAIPSVQADADLAIARHDTGFTAVWASPGSAAQKLELDSAFHGTVAPMMPGPIDAIAGLVLTPQTTLVVTRNVDEQTLWSVPSAATATPLATEATVSARDPFLAEALTSSPRVWLRGSPSGLIGSYITDDGTLGDAKLSPTAMPVIALSATDNFGHGHVTYAEGTSGGIARCTQADIRFDNLQFPLLGGTTLISSDCRTPRITSGPSGSDSIFSAWAASTGEIAIRYLGGAGADFARTLSITGRAPKVAFDGSQFWVAWLEHEAAGDVLRVALVRQDGTTQAVDLPGWIPRGDEAFELVRRAGTVYVAILASDTLSLLETCP